MSGLPSLAKVLGVETILLERLDAAMQKTAVKKNVLEDFAEMNASVINTTLNALNSKNRSAAHVRSILRQTILGHEKHLMTFVDTVKGKNEFEKAAVLAKRITKCGRGFFLKKHLAEEILRKRKPENLLRYLKVGNIDEALAHHDVTELFSALRFIESDEWMHTTFDVAYSGFTGNDFEEREIDVKVLGPEWKSVSEKFVAKKHHNVSHLKEFGVIFLNPIQENIPGKFLRDFALLLHYFHEIEFYSKLFKRYAALSDFSDKLKMLLRGDVPEIYKAEDGEWLIVQRYLAKVDPKDPRLFLPRVNPESMHWARGERDLTGFHAPEAHLDLNLWHDLDWVGGIFTDGGDEVVSFDLEDNAMSLVSFMEGRDESFNYHQRESMWTQIFEEYVGGEEKMEELLIENFDKGVIKF
ncbi:MAG: hypothetical protein Q8P88_00615 [Candidatus Jorgensenbacteria bacterium]|nr:hypothetical protein [Candidatus Jorgensenbacteria bacterium]